MNSPPGNVEARADALKVARPAEHLPGLMLSAIMGCAAFAVSRLQADFPISPILLAILFGIFYRNLVGRPAILVPGIQLAQRRVLRGAIVLLGLQLTLFQIGELGWSGLFVITAALSSCFVFTKLVARAIGVDRQLAELIAAGTAICGVSAIVAVNTVTRAREEHVTYAVACITVLGTVSMVLAPLLAEPLMLSPRDFGLWTGASLHEIAQVVAASFQLDDAAGYHGTIAKLSRVVLLAPLVLILGMLVGRGGRAGGNFGRPPIPWFIFGFLAMVVLNSVVRLPAEALKWIVPATTLLFAMALAAVGLETDIRKLRAGGLKPLLLCAVATLFIAVSSLVLIRLISS
jgi:uncharacterized integral membrane protein (TIGR00698 family)